jgi:hypothetical protein
LGLLRGFLAQQQQGALGGDLGVTQERLQVNTAFDRADAVNLTEFAQAQLIFDSNGNNQLDSGDRITDLGRSSAAISSVQNLETGNYFLTISSTNFQSNTNYRLRIDS